MSHEVINLNPDSLEDLYHTKILESRFANQATSNNWRNILDKGIKIALNKGFSIENLKEKLSVNFKEGNHTLQGFSPIEGANYSWQSQDANKTAKNSIVLAKFLNVEIYVLFEWRENGKFPMQKGLINWNP